MQQRLPSLRETPIGFAHRGARAHARENTIEAFVLALQMGATGLESDVWATADGCCVLDHDGVIRRGLKRESIGRLVRADLPGHIPSFGEVISRVGTGTDFSLDIKDVRAVGPLSDAVASAGFPQQALWLCSPDIPVLEACRERMPDAQLVHSVRFERIPGTLERHVAGLAEIGIGTLNMHHTEWNGGRVTLCHRFGVNAFGWDIQYPDHLRTGLLMGLDAVYSDHTDMMMGVITEFCASRPADG